MADITSFTGIFDRLSTNIEDGNTIIYFSRNVRGKIEYVLLTKVDMEAGIVRVNACNGKLSIPDLLLSLPEDSS